MQSLRNQLRHKTIFSPSCETITGRFLPHIKPIEANPVLLPCADTRENIVSCKNFDIEGYLGEIDGLGFDTVKGRSIATNLPQYVPVIERCFFNEDPALVHSQMIGISLEDIFSSRKDLLINEKTLRSPLFQGKKIILFSTGRDGLIEKIWQKMKSMAIAQSIGRMGFALVTGINYSVFLGECAFAQGFNLKKSLKSLEFFQNVGIETIPHVYFAHDEHVLRWIAWLQGNPSVTTITINCQFCESEEMRAFVVEGLVFLLENLGRPMKILLEGPTRDMLHDLRAFSSSLIVALKEPSMYACFHRRYVLEGGKLKDVPDNSSTGVILKKNIETYERYLQSAFFSSTDNLAGLSLPRETLKINA